jgi:hypothetical protein
LKYTGDCRGRRPVRNGIQGELTECSLLPLALRSDYYVPLEERIGTLRNKYDRVAEAQLILDEEQAEITLYRDYPGWYGYVFYVMKKDGPVKRV